MPHLYAPGVRSSREATIARAVITSAQNPRVKGLIALRRRQERERAGLMLVEGHDELAVAPASGVRPAELYHCRALTGGGEGGLLERAREAGAEGVEVRHAVSERA